MQTFLSRFRDPGRGQGLAGIRRFVGKWSGKLSVRSGSARIALVPTWYDDVPRAENLPFFPGALVQITIPEAVRERGHGAGSAGAARPAAAQADLF